MKNRHLIARVASLFAGLCCLAVPGFAEEGTQVIRDREWTIKIRSRNQAQPATEPMNSAKRRAGAISPVVYRQAEAVQPAPAPVQPAPVPLPETAPAATESEAGKSPDTNPNAPEQPAPVGSPLELVPGVMSPAVLSYEEAYASIPFSRTEYEANPGYRHQAALEVMFRTLRPMTVIQNYTPRAFRYPDSYQIPYGHSGTQYLNIRHFGGGWNFNGQSPFGYPYGLKGN